MASPALQRTVRRGVALVLLQFGTISAQLYEIDSGGSEDSVATFVTIPLFVGSLCYLLGSLGYGALRPRPSEEGAT
ncbi:hypothetical protein DU500_04495 [Haloplanus rubicundus]|uniref:Uncharacterized protein n=1 Tax=Haloplanus rubicundus TaxID=1547898 RepID=A0A345E0N3_9EURY|nr:hypothetical protein [Haloplanus rubicundus]AXG05755.1 hypothetical protein DU500_04495 [Haloplanus rubicundus]AXG09092.1 hypothetical protein DU484_04015 [Haloplanus rubicundus]